MVYGARPCRSLYSKWTAKVDIFSATVTYCRSSAAKHPKIKSSLHPKTITKASEDLKDAMPLC